MFIVKGVFGSLSVHCVVCNVHSYACFPKHAHCKLHNTCFISCTICTLQTYKILCECIYSCIFVPSVYLSETGQTLGSCIILCLWSISSAREQQNAVFSLPLSVPWHMRSATNSSVCRQCSSMSSLSWANRYFYLCPFSMPPPARAERMKLVMWEPVLLSGAILCLALQSTRVCFACLVLLSSDE